jgi:hypothetical protein
VSAHEDYVDLDALVDEVFGPDDLELQPERVEEEVGITAEEVHRIRRQLEQRRRRRTPQYYRDWWLARYTQHELWVMGRDL